MINKLLILNLVQRLDEIVSKLLIYPSWTKMKVLIWSGCK